MHMTRLYQGLVSILLATLLVFPSVMFADEHESTANDSQSEETATQETEKKRDERAGRYEDKNYDGEPDEEEVSNSTTSKDQGYLNELLSRLTDRGSATTSEEHAPGTSTQPAPTTTDGLGEDNALEATTSSENDREATTTLPTQESGGIPAVPAGTVTPLPPSTPGLPEAGGPLIKRGSVDREEIEKEIQQIKNSPIFTPIFALKETYDPANYYALDRFSPRTTKFLLVYAAVFAVLGLVMANDSLRGALVRWRNRMRTGFNEGITTAKIKRKTYGNQ
jgi:hypothetical protein